MAHQDTSTGRISHRLIELCTSSESVSSLLAKDPTLAPGDAWKLLYGHHNSSDRKVEEHEANGIAAGSSEPPSSSDELQRAAKCGKWGPTKPSELFLRV